LNGLIAAHNRYPVLLPALWDNGRIEMLLGAVVLDKRRE